MHTRHNFEIFMIGIFIFLGVDFTLGFFDNHKDYELKKYFVEIYKILIALGIGIYGKLAYKETDSDEKKLVANFYFKLGAGKIVPFALKLALNFIIADKYAEIIKSVYKLIRFIFDFLPTTFYFETLEWWKQSLWSIGALFYKGCRATWGIVGKIGGKPYYIISGLAGAGIITMIILTLEKVIKILYIIFKF